MKPCYIPLKNRSVLCITGKESVDFLQSLLSNNATSISEKKAQYSLLLTPQGKICCDFFICKKDEQYFIDYPTSYKETLLKKLKLYKLRADITLEDMDDSHEVVALIGDAPKNIFESKEHGTAHIFCKGIVYVDPRHLNLGARSIIEKENKYQSFICHDYQLNDYTSYKAQRIAYGVPDCDEDIGFESSFPLDFNLDRLNAIDFDKGCYVGQEVTTRTHRKGKRKKSLYNVSGKAPLPSSGETLYDQDNKTLGIMLSSQDETGLALLRIEEATNAGHKACYGEHILTLDEAITQPS